MSADSALQLDGFGDVREALGAVRAIHGEYAEFFSGVFSRLTSVSDAVTKRACSRDQQLHELQRQQQVWEQERALLERELEAMRNRVAETSEALAQQKRDAQAQQTQWAEELKRMRRALQQMAHRLTEHVETTAASSPAKDGALPRAPSSERPADPVLDSVMAQFELLQNEVARRRNPQQA